MDECLQEGYNLVPRDRFYEAVREAVCPALEDLTDKRARWRAELVGAS